MHASISVGYIYVINEMLNMIRMHDTTMMIKIHKGIFISLLRNSDFVYI